MNKLDFLQLAFSLFIVCSPIESFAKPKNQICIYKSQSGAIKQVSSIYDIPYKLRKHARCFSSAENANLARPDQIKLKGNIRVEDISTSIGRVKLRWPRIVESDFGRTPLRAMTDAARTVSRATKTAAFPNRIQQLNANWNVVFMDENLPQAQIPFNLISGCHPGWMTPPANIYIVAQRVSQGCGGSSTKRSSVADSDLADVLIHELGHAVEYHLLGQHFGGNRMRAEGFATWFEMYAAEYSSMVNAYEIRRRTCATARVAIEQNPGSFSFSGSALDYARAAMYFGAIVDRRGIRGLMDVYNAMTGKGLSFFDAVKDQLYWDRKEFEKEAASFARKY